MYRAALGCNCFGTDDPARLRMMYFQEPLSHLAVALLDARLDVVEGVLIDINAGPGRDGGTYFARIGQDREDCRLALLRRGFYITCKEQIHPVKINRTGASRSSRPTSVDSNLLSYGTRDDHRIPYVYPNICGNGLRITLIGYHGMLAKGKNFNLLKSPRISDDDDMALSADHPLNTITTCKFIRICTAISALASLLLMI
mmetsp:Transcript_21794/g.47576  ORF Transcript_21794/g.47576 Transcript_21794/m.47576 type:complete len:200 (+) Transcript_21794:698-1297(+)